MALQQAGTTHSTPSFDPALYFMDDMELGRTAAAIKAMAHPLRLRLLCIVGPSELSVQEITRHFQNTSQSNISQHLSQLLERDILANRKAGNQVFYSVRDPGILNLIETMKAVFCERLP